MSGILTKSFGQDKKERVNSGELMGEKEQVNIIYDVDNNDLGVALKAANEEVQNVIFKNMNSFNGILTCTHNEVCWV